MSLEQPSQMENLIFRTSIVQSLLDQVVKTEDGYDINIGVPIAKSFEDNDKLIIAGYCSVDVIDSQNELIPLPVLKEAWDKFSSNKNFMIGTLMHSNIPVIHILKEYKDSKGEMWKSQVDDTGLFIVAEVNDSIEKGKQTKELIKDGKLTGFSIGGEALASTLINDGKSYTRIDKMELHEIAVVDKPANKPSVFTIVKRLKQEPKGDKERFINHYQITEEEFTSLFNILGEKLFELLPERGQKANKDLPKEIIEMKIDYSKLDEAIENLDKINKYDISKPYPHEHACRIKEPGSFQEDSFRRINEGNLSIIIGRLKGETKTSTQAFRYPKDKYSVDEARKHCKEQGGSFEAASSEKACKKPKIKLTKIINKNTLFKMNKAISKLSCNNETINRKVKE